MTSFPVYYQGLAILIVVLRQVVLSQYSNSTEEPDRENVPKTKKPLSLAFYLSVFIPLCVVPIILIFIYLGYRRRLRPKPKPLPPPDMMEIKYRESQRHANLLNENSFPSSEHIMISAQM